MKKLLLFLTFLFGVLNASAQDLVERIEGQIGIELPISLSESNTSSKKAYSFEIRYNLKNSPFDVGISGERTSFDAESGKYFKTFYQKGLSVVGNYNFRQGKDFNPFAGIGIGFVHCDKNVYDTVNQNAYYGIGNEFGHSKTVNRPAFKAIVGLEVLSSLRVYASLNISEKQFNTLKLGVAFTIGGRPKK